MFIRGVNIVGVGVGMMAERVVEVVIVVVVRKVVVIQGRL